ncbi:MAG: DUF2213 domain-containing protein [Ruminococcaceae bacterium]|jgi:hypothetical protein|nr:DUF2213 domain-containing protein [Oscillospiraceae bacterium]
MNKTMPKLVHVTRLDSFPVTRATYTDEGYLSDRPILTSTGIFEYKNKDGSIRRELRLPEEVFDPESLESYKGKPIVITHDAGLINRDNVQENQIGTILSAGERDGDDVRADIMIHDTKALKNCRFKELSLGYNLDLEEEPGEWEGQKYDAIQRNIRVNHLAVVREARAGDQARLNIDSRSDNTILTGGHRTMAKKKTRRKYNNDGILSPEQLQEAIAKYKAEQAALAAENQDEDPDEEAEELAKTEVVNPEADVQKNELNKDTDKPVPAPQNTAPQVLPPKKPVAPSIPLPSQDRPIEEKLDAVKHRRDLRDEKGDPKDLNEAMESIAEYDEEHDYYRDIIDTLLAERDFEKGKKADSAQEPIPDTETAEIGDKGKEKDEDCVDNKLDSEDADTPFTDEEEVKEDDEEDTDPFGDEDFADEDLTENEGEEEDPAFADSDLGDPDSADPDNEDDDDEEALPDYDLTDPDIDDADEEEESYPRLNQDSIDRAVRKEVQRRLAIAKVGQRLNMDGLETMSLRKAKRMVIKKVYPSVRLDGKSDAYINGMYNCCVKELKKHPRKDTAYQKRQMFNKVFNKDSQDFDNTDSAATARDKMIERQLDRKPERHSVRAEKK